MTMRNLARSLAVSALAAASLATAPAPSAPSAMRFEALDIFIDAGPADLAVWQVDIRTEGADARIAGVEGGDAPFSAAPYYDPAALTPEGGGHIVVGGFSTSATLPHTKIRVARLTMEIHGLGAPRYTSRLMAAANSPGDDIPATVELRMVGGTH